MGSVSISVREYDIDALSDRLPGSYSHLGLHWSDGRAFNFGSFKNGEYRAVGKPFDPSDRIGGYKGDLGLSYTVVKEWNVDKRTADIYHDAVDLFAKDLYSKNIGYDPVPDNNLKHVNSNTAAKFALSILGINMNDLPLSGFPVCIYKDLSEKRYGLAPPQAYLDAAYARYLDSLPPGAIPVPKPRPDLHCFVAGTPVMMCDGSDVLIETIQLGDIVASFDENADGGRGALVGKRVVRTFVNENQIVIDFHGTKVTPGHAYLCGDGPHEGRFRQIMNIVRDDGAVVLADGSLMRAATGCAVGSPGDAFVEVQIARPARHRETGESVTLLKERGRVRAGTRVQKLDGSFVSFLDLVEANGWTLHEDGLVGQGPGHAPEPLLWAGPSIPKPEDYILALSQLTLADLYSDPQQAERPGLPLSHRQGQGEANAVVLHAAPSREGAEPGANDGYGRTLVRRARGLLGAKRPKSNRVPKQAGETVH